MDRATHPFVASFIKMTSTAYGEETSLYGTGLPFVVHSFVTKTSSGSGYEKGEGSKAVKRLRRFCFSYLTQFYLPLSRDIDKDG